MEHPDGTLVKNSGTGTVYLLEDGEKRHVKSAKVFMNQGFSWSRVKTATSADLANTTGSQLDFREGALVKGSASTIYAIDYETGNIRKRAISSSTVFNLLGYKFSEVLIISDSQLPVTNGPAI
jgi:hypothetical protein